MKNRVVGVGALRYTTYLQAQDLVAGVAQVRGVPVVIPAL